MEKMLVIPVGYFTVETFLVSAIVGITIMIFICAAYYVLKLEGTKRHWW